MPRLKVSDLEMQNRRTRVAILHIQALEELNDAQTANMLGIARQTFQSKMHRLETFTLFELRILVKVLKLTENQQ